MDGLVESLTVLGETKMEPNKRYLADLRNLSLEDAKIELEAWKDSFQVESHNAVMDGDYMNKCVYYSGYLEEHIRQLEE